jgi:hypothetical protein
MPSSWFASSIASCIACWCMASSKGGHQERALSAPSIRKKCHESVMNLVMDSDLKR